MSDQTHPEQPQWTEDPTTGCWIWLGHIDDRGYANAPWKGRAYRLVYEELVGPVPEGYQLHHVCENRACVNPDHLEVLTQREHLRLHWRDRGLTEEQVAEIKRLLRNTTLTQAEIAERFGAPRSTISNIARRRHSGVDDGEKLAPERHCLLCGDTILGRRRQATFCSAAHRRTYNSQQQNRRRKEARAGS